ncbi:shootin-1 [Pundamilia nyererei]|uniref:Shootin-1 n=1 Tax=Pundamilia nyererei TaxID=303518 RepID=A0A9Y6JHY2_9CICH|nr:PREDICTED: shootin-1 [Pundamilia nyererei]
MAMAYWHPLLPTALHEYEDLQRKQETTAMEFKRLEEERDEAMKKLSEFQQVSQMVIEEVSAIQENLEIERTCRESAEALASKLDRQNRSLKRKSMMLLSHISPETIADIDLNDEAEESEDLHASSHDCLSPQCCTSISVLQNKLEMTVKEKNQALSDLEAVRELLRATKEEFQLTSLRAHTGTSRDFNGSVDLWKCGNDTVFTTKIFNPHLHSFTSSLRETEDIESEWTMFSISTVEATAISCGRKAVGACRGGYSQSKWWTLEVRGATKLKKEPYQAWLARGTPEAADRQCHNFWLPQKAQISPCGNLLVVSQLAVEEYETLHDTFNLERDLRTEAENYARAMVVEQKKLKRQSQILMQSSSPSQALQDALSQVTRLTEELETQRLEHQSQIKTMEDMLGSSETQRELIALRHSLELLEEEKKECSNKCSKAELELKDLRFTVEELQKKLQAATNPPPAPTPPPPPPPPPPPALPSTTNPLSTLVSLIRRRRGIRTDIPLVEQDSAKTPEVDVRQQAVEEMMQRIKKGVQLRPVNQSPNSSRKQMEKLPSNSAIQELKGIMENFNRTVQQPKAASPTTTRDDELQRILLRRRDALDA